MLVGSLVGRPAAVQAQDPVPDAPVTAERKAALMNEGQNVYGRDCAECHAEGGIGAALGGNKNLGDKDRVIMRILQGSPDGTMSAFGPSLTDRESPRSARSCATPGTTTSVPSWRRTSSGCARRWQRRSSEQPPGYRPGASRP